MKRFILSVILLLAAAPSTAPAVPVNKTLQLQEYSASGGTNILLPIVPVDGRYLKYTTASGWHLAPVTGGGEGDVTAAGDNTFTGINNFAGGTVTLPSGAVTNAMLAGSIAYGKLNLTGAILNADLAGSIAASKLVGTDIAAVGTVTTGTWQSSLAATGGSASNLTQLILGNTGYGVTATDGYIDQRTTTTSGHGVAVNTLVPSSTGGFNGFDALFKVGTVSDGVNGHTSAFQARQHHDPGTGNTVPAWYGFFSRPYIDSGATTQVFGFYTVDATLAGSPTATVLSQYGWRSNSIESATNNAIMGLDGSLTGSTQAKQFGWIGYRMHLGPSNTAPSNNIQLEIVPMASTVSGRTALSINGGTKSGSGALNTVDISETWDTSGSPTMIYGRITNTASGASAKLLDLGTTAGGSLFSVSKAGVITGDGSGITALNGSNIASGTVPTARLDTSTGGNGAGDSGKVAIFDASGVIAVPAFWNYGGGNTVEIFGDNLTGVVNLQWPDVADAGTIATQEWASATFGGGVDTGADFIWTGEHTFNGVVTFSDNVVFDSLDIGTLNVTTAFRPSTNDGAALGDTTHGWSDAFFASGAVLNFNNGNYTLTHSSGNLTASGPFSVGTSNAITAGSIELGNASTNTLTASSGNLSIEGNAVYRAGGTDVPVPDGGTGVSTLTGIVKGNGTSAFTAATAGTDYGVPSDTAYDATSWNGNTDVPTKNAVRDKIEALGSSAAPDITSRRTTVSLWDEFLHGANMLATSNTGPFGFILAQSGTGVAAGPANVSTTDCPGIIQLENGTGASNYSGFISNSGGLRLGGASYTLEWRVRVPTLTDGTDNFTVRCGFLDSSTGTDGTDGVFFRYSNASANWIYVCRDNSSESGSTTDSGVAVVAGTWYKLRAVVNAAASSVTFTINDAASAAITSNIPTSSSRITGIGANIIRDAGSTERTVQFDYVGLDMVMSSAR